MALFIKESRVDPLCWTDCNSEHGTKSTKLPVIQHGLVYQGIDGGPFVVGRIVTLNTNKVNEITSNTTRPCLSGNRGWTLCGWMDCNSDHGTKSMILPVIQHGLLYQGIDGGPYVV